MVATRKSIPRGSDASDDLADIQDPKAQAVLKALQINAGERLCGAQVLGKRKPNVKCETYTYNGATYEVDQNTMAEWVEKSRKKRKLEYDGMSVSPAPRIVKEKERPKKNSKRMRDEDEGVVEHVEEMERPAKKNRKRTRDQVAFEAAEGMDRPAKMRRMRDTPCMEDDSSPAATNQEPDHQASTRRYRRPIVEDEEDMEDAEVAQEAAGDEIHYAAANSASPRQSAVDDEIHYKPPSKKPRRQEKDLAKDVDKSKSSKEQSGSKNVPDNAADDIRNARKPTKRLVRGNRPADNSATDPSVNKKSAAVHTPSAAITAKVQHESAMECFRNLQRMSKANSRVRAILAKARALKAKLQPPISTNRKSAARAVLSPPTSREPSSIDALDTSPEIPDSDPAGPDRSNATLPESPMTAASLTSSTPPTVASAQPSARKDGDPLRWRLIPAKLNNIDDAAGDIFRHKRQGESQRERRHRRRHEEAVVMSWELQEDDPA